jgi:hypothetical protein
MSTFDYDHELTFTTVFDSAVITNSEIKDKSQDFIDKVNQEFNKIMVILNIYNGVNVMSSFVEWDIRRYKITVRK